MKKNKKNNFIQFRVDDKDYLFLQTLKEQNIRMTDYIINCIKNTKRYQNFNELVGC